MNPLSIISASSNIKTGIPLVTGYNHFSIATIADDVSGGLISNMQLHDGLLRPDFDNDPAGMFITSVGGHDWLEYLINPSSPGSPYLPTGSGFANHFRKEISRYPWELKLALQTELWFGQSFYIPASIAQWVGAAVVLFQVKDSSNAEGDPSPAVSLELAYPGQLNSTTIYRKTPLGGEVQMVNSGRDIRWTPPDSAVRLAPGMRLNYVTQIVFNTDGTGLWRNWFNGVQYEFPGYTLSGDVFPGGDYGQTVVGNYPVDGWRSGNPKHGLYHLGFKNPTLVTNNAAAGHTQMRLLTTDFNMVIRTPASPDYLNMNAYHKVDTSSYNT
jgi:hypothetical protein